MMCPQLADGGDGLQMWRVARNILNKQSWIADRVWSFSLEVGCGADNTISIILLQNVMDCLLLGWFLLINNLS
jgi:hypothetical protein